MPEKYPSESKTATYSIIDILFCLFLGIFSLYFINAKFSKDNGIDNADLTQRWPLADTTNPVNVL
jgi:hypothetical protein